jgi:hypothetical protein
LRDLNEEAATESQHESKDVVLLGFAHDASSLLHELTARDEDFKHRVAVVDFNPDVKHELDRRGIQCNYGDIGHLDTLQHAHVDSARVLVSTIPDMLLKGTSNYRLLRQLRRIAPEAKIIVTATRFAEAKHLYEQGAAFVYLPRLMNVRELREIVLAALDGDLEESREISRAELEMRAEVLP